MTDRNARLRNKCVLIVEDEVLVAMGLMGIFEDAGIQSIGPASCVAEAFRLLEANPNIDAAVLDVNLAGEEVFPVADALLERRIPFVFHTGHETERSLTQRYPLTRVYLKPTLPEELLAGLSAHFSPNLASP